MWETLLFQPLLNGLIFFYRFFGNFGWSILVMTFTLRLLLLPLTWSSLTTAQKMKKIAPQLEKLKKKHKDDKQALAQAQLELYRRQGINPASGCLPQIIQLVVLVAFFQAFNQVLRGEGEIIARLNQYLYPFLKLSSGQQISFNFAYLDLTKPDVFILGKLKLPGFFLVGAALSQFLSSKLTNPSLNQSLKVAKKTDTGSDDLAFSMQKQMLYLFPMMTIFIGFTFPSGLVLYWLVFSLSTLGQQLLVNHFLKKRESEHG
ncbi:YidC/Oxa1 family membrane protein insertase [Patescibacteria group bacterium]